MYQRSYHQRVLKHDAPAPVPRISWKKIVSIAVVAVLLAGIVWCIKTPRFQVTQVSVEGANVADPNELAQFVLSELDGRYLYFFPKSSIVLVSPDTLARAISAKYPRFKSVVVSRDSMRSLKVTVKEYSGMYLWCDREEVCSFMDETGTVFADAPYFSGSAYLKVYKGDREAYPFAGLTQDETLLVTHIYERLRAIDIDPVTVSFDTPQTLRVVFMHGGGRARVLFDPGKDIDAQLEVLYSGIRTQPLASMYHSPTHVLEYLDVRFDNKLVYKFQ
jgi:hypothetical protein